MLPLHLILAALFGWLEREQRDVIEFLREENRVLKAQLHGRRLRLDDHQRRRLAVIGRRLGRRILADIATIVTPDTILRWHRELIARKWTYTTARPGRPGVQTEIRRLAVRMATDNPSWGYTRIQGALKNLGHRVARSTIAKILKEQGIPPSRERPMNVAHVPTGPLARALRRGFLHDGNLDRARVGHLLHGVRVKTRGPTGLAVVARVPIAAFGPDPHLPSLTR